MHLGRATHGRPATAARRRGRDAGRRAARQADSLHPERTPRARGGTLAVIPGITPQVLWKRSTVYTSLNSEPVLTGGHLAFISANVLEIFDLEGNLAGEYGDLGTMVATGLTADPAGDFYFGATYLFRISPTGARRWRTPLAPDVEDGTGGASSGLLLSPDGPLFVQIKGGMLKAIPTGGLSSTHTHSTSGSEPIPDWQRRGGMNRVARGSSSLILADRRNGRLVRGRPSTSPASAVNSLSRRLRLFWCTRRAAKCCMDRPSSAGRRSSALTRRCMPSRAPWTRTARRCMRIPGT